MNLYFLIHDQILNNKHILCHYSQLLAILYCDNASHVIVRKRLYYTSKFSKVLLDSRSSINAQKLLCPPSKNREHIVLLMWVGPSVCLSVDQMVSDHYLENFLSQSFHMLIGLGEDKNPIDFGFTGIKGQGHKGHFCDKLC